MKKIETLFTPSRRSVGVKQSFGLREMQALKNTGWKTCLLVSGTVSAKSSDEMGDFSEN